MVRVGEDIPSLHGLGRERKSRATSNGVEGVGGFAGDINSQLQGDAVGESFNTGTQLLQSLDLDFLNSEQWFNTVGEEGLVDDSMYGLFTL